MRISSLKIVPRLAAQCLLRARGGSLRVSAPLLLFAMLCVFPLIVAPQHLATAQATALSAPTNLAGTADHTGITITWTAPEGQVDGYEILRRRPWQGETDLSTLVNDTGNSDTSYTDTTATELGDRYTYAIKTIRGAERSDASDSVQVDYPTTAPLPPVTVTVSCEILTGNNHDILQCTADAGDAAITSAEWTPSFEAQYAQTTSRPVANWVIADEYCGESTTVTVVAQDGDTVYTAAETTITLECSPAPADVLAISCENVIENNQHKLRCQLSGGDQTVTSAVWTPQYDTDAAQTTEDDNATEATWVVDAEHCGQTSSVEVVPQADTETLSTLSATFSIPCVIMVDNNCSLANAIRSANGNAQVEESGDSDGNDDCEAGADPDESADPPETGDDIILLKKNVTLQEDLPSLTSTVHIEGNGHTISGDAKYRVLTVVGGKLSIKNLNINRGLSGTVGGGIYINSGSLTVRKSSIRNSKASDIGGAIYAIDSDVDIADSEFTGNTTVKSHGGAVYFISSTGLHTLDITGATFKKNVATEDGGALKTAGGIATINKSTFIENQADEGGAIESSETTLNITNSTFSNNSAREGGGLSSFSSFVTLTHTTWAYNSAEEQGGGIAIIGWTGNFKIRNTLITDSKSGGDCHSGPNPNIIIEFTGNLIQDGSCTPIVADNQAAPAADASEEAQAQVVVAEAQDASEKPNVMISGLSGNPPHHPLQWGSPAIDTADPFYCLLDDQPLKARPQYGNCDIGAYEYPRPPLPPAAPEDPPDEDEPPEEPPAVPPPTPEVPEAPICPVNDRIIVRSPYEDMQCAAVDTITIDKHPALQGIRFAMRLWRTDEECTHAVAQGDNLYRLAQDYDTTVEVLRRHNSLESDQLSVGQLLLLPTCSVDAVSFATGTEVCFAFEGNLVLIDTATPERDIHPLASYASDGMTCGQVDRPGIVALVTPETA